MNVIAFDTETKGLNWWDPDEQAFLATWADAHHEYCADLSRPADVARFKAALDNADVIVGHNLKFDVHQVRATLGYDPLGDRSYQDTDLMDRVIHPEGQRKDRGGHGLKNLAKVYLRADADGPEQAIKEMAKEIGLRTMNAPHAYYDVWRAYPEVMERYAVMDARYTYDLYQKFQPHLRDLKRVYELDRAAAQILLRAEERGVKTDQRVVRRMKKQFITEQDKVREYLVAELGEQALGGEGSDSALIESLQKIGVPLHRRTDTGHLSTNKFALQEFERDFPQIAALSEYRKLERFLTTYIGAVEGHDVIHPDFAPTGAWTGRMACRRPNMQNWPQRAGKEVRAVFVPRKGHAFVVTDYSTIEIRYLAYYLGDQGFRDLIRAGHDTHAWMAAQIWGGEMEDWRKDGPLAEGEHSRKTARHTLFAVCYGAGGPRVADMLGIPIDEARSLVAKVKASLPNYQRLNKRIRNKIETLGYVNTVMGRKNPVMKDKSYVGMNALIQGSAADTMKQGLILAAAAVEPLGGIPLMVVHDEIVTEVPIENAEECCRVQEAALCSAYELDPPLAVESHITTKSYADA